MSVVKSMRFDLLTSAAINRRSLWAIKRFNCFSVALRSELSNLLLTLDISEKILLMATFAKSNFL